MTPVPNGMPETEEVLSNTAVSTSDGEEAILRIYAERLNVELRPRRTAVVRASSVTEEREQEVREMLASERVDIVHVPIGRPVDFCPPVRVEGDTTILSIVEEVLVIERRLVLKEEVHMTKVRTTAPYSETVRLREQHAVISRELND